jgi:hypothetical protein
MKVKGWGVSLIVAAVLSSVPISLFTFGVRDFHDFSVFWYALEAPRMTGVALLYDLIVIRLGGSYRWMNVCGFTSALICWFALAQGVRVVVKQQTAKAWLRGICWWTLFVVVYGLGAWGLYGAWHAP